MAIDYFEYYQRNLSAFENSLGGQCKIFSSFLNYFLKVIKYFTIDIDKKL
jgi:hypothetical protein